MLIEHVVKSKYGAVATSGLSSDHDGVRAVAEAFGYSAEQLGLDSEAEANMGPILRTIQRRSRAYGQARSSSTWAVVAVWMSFSRQQRLVRPRARRSASI